MKNQVKSQEGISSLLVILIIILVSVIALGGVLTYQYYWQASEKEIETETPTDKTADWETYVNEKHGYSLKYPAGCFYGPLPGECKQLPPEERSQECLCSLNAENPDVVHLYSFIGEKDNLRLAAFEIFHYSSDFYNPPVGSNLIDWLKEKAYWQDIPNEINMELDGMPAVRVYTPQTQGAYSLENIYFINEDKLFNISMVNVDNKYNKKLYNQMLSTFKFLE